MAAWNVLWVFMAEFRHATYGDKFLMGVFSEDVEEMLTLVKRPHVPARLWDIWLDITSLNLVYFLHARCRWKMGLITSNHGAYGSSRWAETSCILPLSRSRAKGSSGLQQQQTVMLGKLFQCPATMHTLVSVSCSCWMSVQCDLAEVRTRISSNQIEFCVTSSRW